MTSILLLLTLNIFLTVSIKFEHITAYLVKMELQAVDFVVDDMFVLF